MRFGLLALAALLAASLGALGQETGLGVAVPSLKPGGILPSKYTRAGGNVSPPLQITGLPAKAVTYAVLMDDLDGDARVSVHWLVANLPASLTNLPEGKPPKDAIVGNNSWDRSRYDGPERTDEPHRYFIKVYALDVVPDLRKGFTREDFITLIGGHIVGTAQVMVISNGAK